MSDQVAIVSESSAGPHLAALSRALAVVIRGAVDAKRVAGWAEGVVRAREHWTHDFGGEQFSLGRAFYTHLEEGRLERYFSEARASDARVEAAAPGLQGEMRALVAKVTGGVASARRDFCGPGVHIFPENEKVAREGGIVHFDTEGLPARHLDARRPALSCVLMMSRPETGGGLMLWDVLYEGEDGVDDDVLDESEAVLVTTSPGDVVVFDSYRLHQIQPFGGGMRISATVHAAETARACWETWF